MWGLKSPSGDIMLPSEYDKVEVWCDGSDVLTSSVD